MGGAFDPAFQEQAPAGGLLIGFEITLGKFADRKVIRSLRPIYRTSEDEETKGKEYGDPDGKVYRAKAKPGYAVGGVNLRTGLLIDGMSVIFMKTNGAALDPKDSYETEWVGNKIGGSASTLTGEGIPIVGFAAKVTGNNKECSGMGLILKCAPNKPAASAKSPKPASVSAGSSKLTRENFDQIENGMKENEVTTLLGPFTSRSQRTTIVLTWNTIERNPDGSLHTTVTVTLKGGKVAGKNWKVINFPKP